MVLRPIAMKIVEIFERLAKVDKLVKFFTSWTVDIDEVVLWLKWLARGGSSHPRFTEATWLVGAAEGGKDMLIAILQAMFGTNSDGLVATLTYQYVTGSSSSSWCNKESCAPFLRSCAAARFIIISEIPNLAISMALLKPLCEQRGALVAARGLYEGSHGFRPMALPLLTSNFTPKLCVNESQDRGAKTRIRVYSTPNIFTLDATMASHRAADVTLGDAANAGELNASLFFFLRGIYRLLDLSPESRNVGPLPARVAEETQLCFVSGPVHQSKFEEWVREKIVAATAATSASTGDVYKSALAAVGEDSPEATQLRALLTSAGFHQDKSTRTKSHRYYTKLFPGKAEALPVALK